MFKLPSPPCSLPPLTSPSRPTTVLHVSALAPNPNSFSLPTYLSVCPTVPLLLSRIASQRVFVFAAIRLRLRRRHRHRRRRRRRRRLLPFFGSLTAGQKESQCISAFLALPPLFLCLRTTVVTVCAPTPTMCGWVWQPQDADAAKSGK